MITSILVLQNNYVWILFNIKKFCIIVDPGEFKPVQSHIKKNNWTPVAILITHDHLDHTNGVDELLYYYPNIKIYGPSEYVYKTNKITVSANTYLYILNYKIHVIDTKGHTKNHVSYYTYPYLFCGDTLFSGGCGKVSKKLYKEMYFSIRKLTYLPEEVFICCGHEYTYKNILFTKKNFNLDQTIKKYFYIIKQKIKFNESLISNIRTEKKINIFLKTNESKFKIKNNFKYKKYKPWDNFKFIRKLKDKY